MSNLLEKIAVLGHMAAQQLNKDTFYQLQGGRSMETAQTWTNGMLDWIPKRIAVVQQELAGL